MSPPINEFIEIVTAFTRGEVDIDEFLAFYHPEVIFSSMDAVQGKMIDVQGTENLRHSNMGFDDGLFDMICNKVVVNGNETWMYSTTYFKRDNEQLVVDIVKIHEWMDNKIIREYGIWDTLSINLWKGNTKLNPAMKRIIEDYIEKLKNEGHIDELKS